MKDLKNFLNESIVNESKIDFDDAVEVFRNWLDRDDFSLDFHGEETGTGWDAIDNGNSIGDLIEWTGAGDDLAEQLDTDKDTLFDWFEKNEKKLNKELGIK